MGQLKNKDEIRREMKEKRASLSPEEITAYSAAIIKKLTERDCYRKNIEIYCYVSYNGEVSTREFLEKALSDGKKVAVPKVIGRQMKFYYIDSLKELRKGYLGIPEPSGDREEMAGKQAMAGNQAMAGKALVILPGLAFDRQGNRIGYGGGYYDRYLKAGGHDCVGICYDFQLWETLPFEEYDIKADEIITPDRVIEWRKSAGRERFYELCGGIGDQE